MNKKVEIDKIINNHVLYSMGLGIIPIPFLDIIAVTALQLDMLSQIGKVYGKNFSEISGKSFIASTAGASIARIGASVIKSIPGIGSVLGGVSMAIMSGASTYAIGQVADRFIRDGLDFEDIDVDLAKSIYEEEFEKGKAVAKDLKAKADAEKSAGAKTDPIAEMENSADDVYAKLEKLGDLKTKGIITEEEFQSMKAKLIG